jgi:hypothetical protein
MIDAHQDVRWGLDGLLTVGDIIAALNTGRAGGRVTREWKIHRGRSWSPD